MRNQDARSRAQAAHFLPARLPVTEMASLGAQDQEQKPLGRATQDPSREGAGRSAQGLPQTTGDLAWQLRGAAAESRESKGLKLKVVAPFKQLTVRMEVDRSAPNLEPMKPHLAELHPSTKRRNQYWQSPKLEARALVKTCCEVAQASRTAQSSVPASRSHTVSHLVKVMGSPSQRNPKPASGIRRTPFLSTVRVSPAMRNRALKLHCPAWQVHVQATTVQTHRRLEQKARNPSSWHLAPAATIRFEQGGARTRTGQCAQDPEQTRPLLIEIRP